MFPNLLHSLFSGIFATVTSCPFSPLSNVYRATEIIIISNKDIIRLQVITLYLVSIFELEVSIGMQIAHKDT